MLEKEKKFGKLYLVGTPIGNLEDMSFRAIRILKEADLIAAEDTRQTVKLLNYFGISTPLVSYYKFNAKDRIPVLLNQLKEGKNIALVTDAGMPGISDPGAEIVPLALENGIKVVPVPGPSAITTALVASGLTTQQFVFYGFLARSGLKRKRQLQEIAAESRTVVFFEAPQRLVETLKDLSAVCGQRKIVLARELTKIHEEFLFGTAASLLTFYEKNKPRGEYTVLVAGKEKTDEYKENISIDDGIIMAMELLAKGMKATDAVKQVAVETGLERNSLYKEMMKRLERSP